MSVFLKYIKFVQLLNFQILISIFNGFLTVVYWLNYFIDTYVNTPRVYIYIFSYDNGYRRLYRSIYRIVAGTSLGCVFVVIVYSNLVDTYISIQLPINLICTVNSVFVQSYYI